MFHYKCKRNENEGTNVLSFTARDKESTFVLLKLLFACRVNPARAHSKDCQPYAILAARLGINRAQIIPHGLFRQRQFLCNLAILVSLRDENHDFFFRWSQGIQGNLRESKRLRIPINASPKKQHHYICQARIFRFVLCLIHFLAGAQKDAQPLNGGRPTQTWALGEFLTDPYTLEIKPDVPKANTKFWWAGMTPATPHSRDCMCLIQREKMWGISWR